MSGATPCIDGTADECTNPKHDHFGQIDAAENGTGIDTGDDLLVCVDCTLPMHYDEDGGDYYHDDPSAPPCFLIRRETPRMIVGNALERLHQELVDRDRRPTSTS